jgi:tRNA-specific 2-thiouridylase
MLLKDMKNNTVYVSRNLNDESMWKRELTLSSVHWINNSVTDGTNVQVRLRHRGSLLPATIYDNGERVTLQDPERSIATGQSVVFYDGEVCLGGGVVTDL